MEGVHTLCLSRKVHTVGKGADAAGGALSDRPRIGHRPPCVCVCAAVAVTVVVVVVVVCVWVRCRHWGAREVLILSTGWRRQLPTDRRAGVGGAGDPAFSSRRSQRTSPHWSLGVCGCGGGGVGGGGGGSVRLSRGSAIAWQRI